MGTLVGCELGVVGCAVGENEGAAEGFGPHHPCGEMTALAACTETLEPNQSR